MISASLVQPAVADSVQNSAGDEIEVSIVMPCLNEAETVGICVAKARQALEERQIAGEVIVADNGSADGSQRIAAQLGARVTPVQARGYGSALMGGIAAARGRYIIMGDADDSYDFREIPRFVELHRQGHELVQGCRLPQGGGRVMPGAMPALHRWLGNPLFSFLVRRMFRAPIHDVYCGLRGFTRELYNDLNLRCTGMEFATEMVIKSSVFRRRIVETPITLHPDGRKTRRPHLRTFRDGWRTLRFFLMCSPRWLFLHPGVGCILLGMLGYALAMPGVTILGAALGAHTLLVSSLFLLLGCQAVQFALLAKTFAVAEGLLPLDQRLRRFYEVATLERGLLLGAAGFVVGVALIGWAVYQWRLVDFGPLEYGQTMRAVIPGVTLAALGFQTVLASFMTSILGMSRR